LGSRRSPRSVRPSFFVNDERVLPRLLLGQERRFDHLPPGDRATELRRGGLKAGLRGRGSRCQRPIRRRPPRTRNGPDWPSGCGGGGVVRSDLRRPAAPRRGLPSLPRPAGQRMARFRLATPRWPERAQGPSDRQGGAVGELIEAGLLVSPRTGARPSTAFATGSSFPLPILGSGGLVRRPGDGFRRAGQVPQRPRYAALRQGGCSMAWPRRAGFCTPGGEGAALGDRPRLFRRHSPASARAIKRPWRLWERRSPRPRWRSLWRLHRCRRCASTPSRAGMQAAAG